MAYSYKGSISFGLVYIPVKLHASVKENDIPFNMLDKQTMSRVKYKRTCVDCGGREIKQEDIVKGYQYEDDKYVVFSDEELEKLKTEKDKSITIEKFIDIADVDAMYFDRSFYVEPTGAERAYNLLLRAMEEEGKAGLAKSVLGNKETLMLLRANKGHMLVSTLYFYDEIQKPSFSVGKADINQKEFQMTKSIISGMAERFDPEEYRDHYRDRLMSAIEDKIAGKEIVAPEEKVERVADLMDALQSTLSGLKKDKPEDKKSAEPAKAKKSAAVEESEFASEPQAKKSAASSQKKTAAEPQTKKSSGQTKKASPPPVKPTSSRARV